MYQVPVYQMYQEDQISGATYISDVVFIFPQSETPSCQMEAVGRVWEALDKLSVDNPEEYKQVSAHL